MHYYKIKCVKFYTLSFFFRVAFLGSYIFVAISMLPLLLLQIIFLFLESSCVYVARITTTHQNVVAHGYIGHHHGCMGLLQSCFFSTQKASCQTPIERRNRARMHTSFNHKCIHVFLSIIMAVWIFFCIPVRIIASLATNKESWPNLDLERCTMSFLFFIIASHRKRI